MATFAENTNATPFTVAQHTQTQTQTQNAAASARFWEELEFNRFGFVALLLVVMVCMGGLAAAVAINGSEWKLLVVAFSTVVVQFLVMIIAPMRMIVFATAAALFIDLLVFLT
jgi:hypothetical protein